MQYFKSYKDALQNNVKQANQDISGCMRSETVYA